MSNVDDPPRRSPAPAGAMPTREERLAAKLRENLRRRKVQARALDGNPLRAADPAAPDPDAAAESDAALSKPPPSR